VKGCPNVYGRFALKDIKAGAWPFGSKLYISKQSEPSDEINNKKLYLPTSKVHGCVQFIMGKYSTAFYLVLPLTPRGKLTLGFKTICSIE
jgi:hypothetical protein